MAFEYKKGSTNSQVVNSNPYWILVVIPYAERFTLSMSDLVNGLPTAEIQTVFDKKAQAGDPIILDNHCVKWNVHNSKSMHIQSASFTLAPPSVIEKDGTSKLNEYNIAPQDWVMFWAMDNEEDYLRIKEAISKNQKANDAMSGLKFIGQVSSFKSQLFVSSSGVKLNRYSMECHGFREFDGTVYYNELAQTAGEAINNQISEIAKQFGFSYVVGLNSGLKITPQQAMVIFSTVFLEYTLSERFGSSAVQAGATAEAQNKILLSAIPNRGYIVPDIVATLLGQIPSGNHYYSKILYRYIGVQQYNYSIYGRNPSVEAVRGDGFATYWGDSIEPYQQAIVSQISPNQRPMWHFTHQLDETLAVETLNFDGRSVWSLLGTYLDHPSNEMYTTLKVTPFTDKSRADSIMPSFVCRQIPYSSTYYGNNTSKQITRFAELPRWIIDDTYITSYNIGMSDSVDANYVKVEPSFVSGSLPVMRQQYELANPAIMDRTDISRNGLRMFRRQTAAIDGLDNAKKDANGNVIVKGDTFASVREKQTMLADVMMRLKYTVNGSLNCKGIQEPICVGDNLVVKDTLFHIESIVHEGGIGSAGEKSFNTTFALSHGIKINADETKYSPPQQVRSPDDASANFSSQ